MTPRIRPLVPTELSAEQRLLHTAITGGPRAQGVQHFALAEPDGSLRGPFDAMLRSPAVGAAQQELGAALRFRAGLTDRVREIAILLVAAHWDSAFERESHEAVARGLGFGEDELAALRALDVSALPAAESTAGKVAIELLSGDLSDGLWAEASTALGATAVYELTALVGYYSTLALQLRVFRVGE